MALDIILPMTSASFSRGILARKCDKKDVIQKSAPVARANVTSSKWHKVRRVTSSHVIIDDYMIT